MSNRPCFLFPPVSLHFTCLNVLKVMLSLLRRYPLTAEGANPAGSLATAEDEEACRMDFDAKAPGLSPGSPSSQVGLNCCAVFLRP